MSYKFFIMIAAMQVNLLLAETAQSESWTWFIKKKFQTEECEKNSTKAEIVFAKTDIPPFTQAIFSWNALRPSHGFFRFFAQVRDAKTKLWHDFHHMFDWGRGRQCSYSNDARSGTKFKHVRLELPSGAEADGLRVRIKSSHGADLACFRSIAANVSHMPNFKEEYYNAAIAALPSVTVHNIPQQSQMILDHPKADALCSPTSCCMLASYLMGCSYDPVIFAESVFDQGLEVYGSWPFNTAHVFELSKGKLHFHVARLSSFADIHKRLKKNIPVVVSVRGKLRGAPKEYGGGHLLLVVGWDKKRKKVLCHDPAYSCNEDVYAEYDFKSFAAAWGRSRHLAYIADPLPAKKF